MQEQCSGPGDSRKCRYDAHALHVQILRMASSADVNEALLSQLNVARNKVRRSSTGSGGNGGDSTGGGRNTGGSNPLAAGTAAAVLIPASANERATCPASCPQQQPPVAVNAAELQHRIPSGASVDGTAMYGAFEDTAWLFTADHAGSHMDGVTMTAPPGSGGSGHCNSGIVPAYINPFAAVAEQRQRQSQSDRLAAQEAAESQQNASGTLYSGPTLGNSDPNDSAIERHRSLVVKCQDAETALDSPHSGSGSRPCSIQSRRAQAIADERLLYGIQVLHLANECSLLI